MKVTWKILGTLALIAAGLPAPALAGEADVVDVRITPQGQTSFRFEVAVRHADEGWDHFANRWEVVGPDGQVLGTRELAHPHVNEQPFTRSTTVSIPADIAEVTVRAHDSVHAYGGREMTVAVPRGTN